MKKIISLGIGLSIVVLLCYGGYKFFFDCKKSDGEFDRIFILENPMDYVKIEKEAVVKLIKVEDDRCLEETCEREGQILVKALVLNDNRISYVSLGTLSESKQEIEKLGYIIELDSVNENGVYMKLSKVEKKKK